MKKKGVSPLIATVLVIAFVIILFGLITTWTRRAALEPAMQTGEEKIASTLECAELDIDIVKSCKATEENKAVIKTTIDNRGSKDLYGIKIRAIGATGVEIGEFSNINIEPLGRSDVLVLDVSGKGTISKIEVYPMTTTGTCQDMVISTTAIAATC